MAFKYPNSKVRYMAICSHIDLDMVNKQQTNSNKILNRNIELGSPVQNPQRQPESNESAFEGCWGAENPTPD
jgi:hypothetical protein